MASTARSAAKLLLSAALTAAAIAATAPAAHAERSEPHPDLAQVRRATARYHDAEQAIADGFIPTEHCVAQPALGGMGLHYVHLDRLADPAIRADQPEVLLYEPNRNGHLRLVAVEWVSVDRDQNLDTDDDRPSVLGQELFGPMPGHEPGMPVHYDLHAWIWKHNPAGTFANWNPDVRCPTDS